MKETLPDFLTLAAQSWDILTKTPDHREAFQELLRFLAGSLHLSFLEFHSQDSKALKFWTEGSKIPGGQGTTEGTRRPFPNQRGFWIIGPGGSPDPQRGVLFDLLARQWQYLNPSPPAPLRSRKSFIQNEFSSSLSTRGWTALSLPARNLVKMIPSLANNPAPLFIQGETGSGKEYLARTLHDEGPRPERPFHLWEGRIPSKAGTLYVPQAWQLSLSNLKELRGALAKPGEHRIVLSTEKKFTPPLPWPSSQGLFIRVPPLRERREDIPLLIEEIFNRLTSHERRRTPSVSPTALKALSLYFWPGNFTELMSVLQRILQDPSVERLSLKDLPGVIRGVLPSAVSPAFPHNMEMLQYEALQEELTRQKGHITHTAEALGLSPRQIAWRIKKYGINRQDFKTKKS